LLRHLPLPACPRRLRACRHLPPPPATQVVDMELGAQERVLGARLLPGGATSVLLVLTQRRLLCYQLA
jgi:hypothetical protein